MHFNDPGVIAEAEVIAAATRLGFTVSRPLRDGARYDLIFDDGGQTLCKVQVKTATVSGDVVEIRLRTCRHTPGGYRTSTYDWGEIDIVVAYCAELDICFSLTEAEVVRKTKVHLRLGPPKNNQRRRVHWAAHHQFGAIAQLGERLHGMQEVAGSSPASSTRGGPAPSGPLSFPPIFPRAARSW